MEKKTRFRDLKASLAPSIKEWKFMLHRVKKSPLSLVGMAIIIFYVIIALLAPVLAPADPSWALYKTYDPFRIPRDSYTADPSPPSARHPFGTTEYQYDLFYGIMWGTITAFRVGLWVTFSGLAIGLIIGMLAGYYGGAIDELMMRFTDIIIAFPGLILAMALVAAFGASLDNVMLALILVGWPSYARVIRGEILRVKQEDYIEAAKAAGCSDLRVMAKHILPNAIYPVIIMASLDTGAVVLSAAALSFLGLGAPVDFSDWGQLIARSQNWIVGTQSDPLANWHTFVLPGVFIFTFVLGWNLLGDAFRDILDPTLRRR